MTVGMTMSCIPSTIQKSASAGSTRVTASAVFGTALLFTMLAGTPAAPRWARCYLDRRGRKPLSDLGATLRAAQEQGLLVVDEGAYHFTDAVLNRHYAGALPHPGGTSPARAVRRGGLGA
ncbi:UNVERIFIED_CONTAM: hypothetical protein RKD43_006598 [Streptomyces graminofaciens]